MTSREKNLGSVNFFIFSIEFDTIDLIHSFIPGVVIHSNLKTRLKMQQQKEITNLSKNTINNRQPTIIEGFETLKRKFASDDSPSSASASSSTGAIGVEQKQSSAAKKSSSTGTTGAKEQKQGSAAKKQKTKQVDSSTADPASVVKCKILCKRNSWGTKVSPDHSQQYLVSNSSHGKFTTTSSFGKGTIFEWDRNKKLLVNKQGGSNKPIYTVLQKSSRDDDMHNDEWHALRVGETPATADTPQQFLTAINKTTISCTQKFCRFDLFLDPNTTAIEHVH